jgi:hypothetical protein
MTNVGVLGRNIAKILVVSVSLIWGVISAAQANDVVSIESFMEGNKTASFMDIQFMKPKKKEQVIVVMGSLEAATIDMMMVFKDDQCTGEVKHSQGNGSFKLNCVNGGEMKSGFSCTSAESCFMRGKHSQRGKFIFTLSYRPQQMSVEEILSFTAPRQDPARQLANAPQSSAPQSSAPQSNAPSGTAVTAETVASAPASPKMSADGSAQTGTPASMDVASNAAAQDLRNSIAEVLQKSGGYSKAFIFGQEKMEGFAFIDFSDKEEWKHQVVFVVGEFECLSLPERDLSVAKLRCLNGDEYLGVVQDVGDGARVQGAFRDYGDAKIVIPQLQLGSLKDALRTVDRGEYDQISALADPSQIDVKTGPAVQDAPLAVANNATSTALPADGSAGQGAVATPVSTAAVAATAPVISITRTSASGPQGIVEGRVSDQSGIAELQVNGRVVAVDGEGNFSAEAFVPIGGAEVTLRVFNVAGLSAATTVTLERASRRKAALSFAQLNPMKRKAATNSDAIALIVGVADYASAVAPAVYADTDAQVFYDYAVEKLGVPASRIEMLINDAADEKGMLLAVKRWLTRVAKPGKSDVYVFFAGHGLASDDGENMYLLPYDGAPELLDDTAILRDRLFQDIASAKPRSVTVFLDTCYSGATRGTEMLIASRPIAIRAKEKSIPEGFTLITAAAGDETAKPLEETRHGMFSYFLMKGMEGEADGNGDNQITAGELHYYVQQNVVQQSSGTQTPTIKGNLDRVLVRFQ